MILEHHGHEMELDVGRGRGGIDRQEAARLGKGRGHRRRVARRSQFRTERSMCMRAGERLAEEIAARRSRTPRHNRHGPAGSMPTAGRSTRTARPCSRRCCAGPDARQHQQLRRAEHAARQHHRPPRADLASPRRPADRRRPRRGRPRTARARPARRSARGDWRARPRARDRRAPRSSARRSSASPDRCRRLPAARR